MKRDESVDLYRLLSCPRNSRYIAGGQLAVFQGASEAPISESYGSSGQLGKTANWPRPGGCDENGPAAALLVGHVSIQICSLLAPCRRPILIATIYLLFRGQDTSLRGDCWACWRRKPGLRGGAGIKVARDIVLSPKISGRDV